MSKKEKSSNQIPQILAVIFYAAAYIAAVAFQSRLSQRQHMLPSMYQGPDLTRHQAITTAVSGSLAQICMLFSAFVVLAVGKKGYVTSIILNFISILSVVTVIIKTQTVGSIPGIIVPFSTVILCTIVFIFSNKVRQKSEELSKSYEQLMETNRIIKDKDEKLSYLAYYDVLTSLPNRHLFIEKMDESIVNNANMPFTVILCDLDNFKIINNTYGSSAGDVLLATYAEKFKSLCDDSTFLGRIGGNEYGFIVQGNNSEANILNFIEKIQNILSEPVQIGSDVISSTASFGIASYPNNAVSSSEILTCINSAVSYAKSNGKNRPCFYEQY